jgi:CubicO group peptidase (beta-lactamase class C family)
MPSPRTAPALRLALGLALLLALLPSHLAFARQATPEAALQGLRGMTPFPLTGERRAAFEASVADALVRFRTPGAAVAVVQNGEVVYLNGLGVTAYGGTQPVTPDTMMMIGSITKSMTTMLAANLVDAGQISWDTPLVDLLPGFAVADPALTRTLSLRDAFCNCSGIPGRNVEGYFASTARTPEEVVTALAETAPVAPRGERYLYNNLLIAAGGYALGAVEAPTDDLGLAYDTALRTRILGPIGMPRSTFDLQEVLAGGDYALPHAIGMEGDVRSLSLLSERGLVPVRPAGGLWSNAREMARYLQTALARGVAPDGTRVVSAENLTETWAPEVAIPPSPGLSPTMSATNAGYALGWNSGDYHGLRIISHTGGTTGFSAVMAFLPEADLGIVVLTNSLQASLVAGDGLPYAVQFRLLEILFDQPPRIDAELAAIDAALAARRPRLAPDGVDPAAVQPYLGRYAHPQLGEVTISLRGNRLLLDSGILRSELRHPAGDPEGTTYLLADPPLSFYSELAGATVTLSGEGASRQLTLTVPANPTGPEVSYVLTPVANGTPVARAG